MSGERAGCGQGCGVVALSALAGTVLVVGLSAVGAWLSDRATEPTVSQRYYTVQPGDTLGGIAARHGVTVDALTRVNRLPNPDRLKVNDVLTIPPHGDTPPPRAKPPEPPRRQSSASAMVYAFPCAAIVYSDPGLMTVSEQRACYLRIVRSHWPDSDKRLLLNMLGWTDWTGAPRFKLRR